MSKEHRKAAAAASLAVVALAGLGGCAASKVPVAESPKDPPRVFVRMERWSCEYGGMVQAGPHGDLFASAPVTIEVPSDWRTPWGEVIMEHKVAKLLVRVPCIEPLDEDRVPVSFSIVYRGRTLCRELIGLPTAERPPNHPGHDPIRHSPGETTVLPENVRPGPRIGVGCYVSINRFKGGCEGVVCSYRLEVAIGPRGRGYGRAVHQTRRIRLRFERPHRVPAGSGGGFVREVWE